MILSSYLTPPIVRGGVKQDDGNDTVILFHSPQGQGGPQLGIYQKFFCNFFFQHLKKNFLCKYIYFFVLNVVKCMLNKSYGWFFLRGGKVWRILSRTGPKLYLNMTDLLRFLNYSDYFSKFCKSPQSLGNSTDLNYRLAQVDNPVCIWISTQYRVLPF